LTVPSHLFK